jgi:hypothetical protein
MLDSIDAYLEALLEAIATSPVIHSSNISVDKRTMRSGLIKRDLYFAGNTCLHFRDLVEVQTNLVRLIYSYHYQRVDGTLVFRYDDTPHHPNLPPFPHHKHVNSEGIIIPCELPDLSSILREIKAVYPTAA